MENKYRTATYKCSSDFGGRRYSFYCDISHAIVCSTEPIHKNTISEELEFAWKTTGEKYFNKCKKCGKWVIDALYNPEKLECVICSPWETDIEIEKVQEQTRNEFGFGPDAMKKKKVCRWCKYICNTEGNFCHICGSMLPNKTLFDTYGQRRNEREKGLFHHLSKKQMKKALMVMLLICMMGTLVACGDKTSVTEKEEAIREIDVVESTVDSVVEKEPEAMEQPQEHDSAKEDEKAEEQSPMPEKPQILSLQETRNAQYEGIGAYEKLLLISEFNYVTFWEGAEKYPEMDRTLSERAGMIKSSQEDEADNILSFAQEMFDVDSYFETQVSTVDVQVRRADSLVVSYLTDSYADYGFIENFRGMWGSNYDAQTGQELVLTDVIKDMTQIPALVEKELNSHLWAGEGYSETAIRDYFQNTPEDGIGWTLDYNGVTFYFGDGELTEPGNGGQTATISFAERPELFEEKYMNVPEAYMVRLPLDSSFFTDLDGDSALEELNVAGVYNEEGRFYSQLGIYTDTDGYYHYEELFAYGYNPYYVKTADGKHYLYLFCEENDADNRQMMLVVFNVSDGQFVRVGEMNVAPPYIPSDIFILPLNPNHILLDNFDSLEQDFGVYMVGENGMPIRK